MTLQEDGWNTVEPIKYLKTVFTSCAGQEGDTPLTYGM